LGYDTIYGAQDMSDDEIIGLKSTSIKFKDNIKLFVLSCYLITSSLIIFLFKDIIGFNTFSLLLFIFFLSLVYQVFYFDQFQPKKCLKIFKANNYSGLIFFLGIFLINY
jgi:4-hydroxybenzoate polyprenyltransferase